MSRPISPGLLVHTVQFYKKNGNDTKGKPSYDEPVTVEMVRVDPSTSLRKTDSGDFIQLTALLFYDCFFSQPEGISFSLNDKIVFEGKEHFVKSVEKDMGYNQYHHFEIGLV